MAWSWGIVASDGNKMPPHFFRPNEKVNSDVYYKVLRYKVLPWLKITFPRKNYVFTQDGAPAHTSKKVQEFCKGNMASFWAISSPDVNPLDFSVWVSWWARPTQNLTPQCRSSEDHHTKEWGQHVGGLHQDSCASVRPRIEAIIRNNGGHIK
ncbi:Uncharacterized protein FKW44_001390 [Caligus rogercresseyi]|uniref:Tc1-like transposase DDE domain-containing protein n=1 Tax=Caligus rogercresseyi TaxID=217165 RepID=A0A7T8KIP9_CALRO|nr:Uncharacterized protein FKW44_001390 [Caligus rogercresseyi]